MDMLNESSFMSRHSSAVARTDHSYDGVSCETNSWLNRLLDPSQVEKASSMAETDAPPIFKHFTTP